MAAGDAHWLRASGCEGDAQRHSGIMQRRPEVEWVVVLTHVWTCRWLISWEGAFDIDQNCTRRRAQCVSVTILLVEGCVA